MTSTFSCTAQLIIAFVTGTQLLSQATYPQPPLLQLSTLLMLLSTGVISSNASATEGLCQVRHVGITVLAA